MIVERKRFALRNTILICGFIIYLALTQFSEYWLGIITQHDIGEDFLIYFDAYTKAVSGENPYLPYNIGSSFVNHPFVLSFISLFSWHQEEFLAIFFWVITSAIMWVFVIGLVVHLTKKVIIGPARKGAYREFGWILVVLLGFAPFWETVHIGQINIFVILCLCLMYYYSEKGNSITSGIFLALAIVLKTSPAIFILYYLVLRNFRLVTSCLVSLILLSVISAIQFSPDILIDFLAILPELGKEIHPTPYNQSILSLSYRILTVFELERTGAFLITVHKVVFVCVFGVILLLTLTKPSTKVSRLYGFGIVLSIMTLFSPLVWYHHSIFLIVPLVTLILHPNHRYKVLGIGLIFVIQFERLFEQEIINFAWPICLAEFILLGLGIWLYYNNWRGLSTEKTLA